MFRGRLRRALWLGRGWWVSESGQGGGQGVGA